MEFSRESRRTNANLLSGLMLANYSSTLCLNRCPQVCICVEILMQRRVESRHDQKRPVAAKIWPYPVFNEQDHNVKVKASILQAERRELTVSVLMDFFYLQHCVQNNRLLLSLLSLSRCTCIPYCRR